MTNVIDFFSRRPLASKQDTEENDRSTSEEGLYIGNIGKNNAAAFVSIIAVLERLSEEIMALSEEFAEYDTLHYDNTERIVTMLKAVNKFDHATQQLMVSEEGHVWIVPKEDEGDEE